MNMKIVLRSWLLKRRFSLMHSHENHAVSEILGLVLVLMIVTGVISTILFWGVPYMQDKKAFVALENALLQFDAMGNLIDDAFSEGVFDVDNGEVVNSSKTMTFQLGDGDVQIDTRGERFVFWYSLADKYDFNVSDFDPDGDENSFSIDFTDGSASNVDVYYLYDNSLPPDLDKAIGDPTETEYSLHDAVQIDVKDGSDIVGRIWLFDVGSLIYESVGSSGVYKAIVENGGVLSTVNSISGNFFNEPKYWPQARLDNSSMLTLRMIQIKNNPNDGVDAISGTGSSKADFCIRPCSSMTMESKTQLFSNFKMKIYGDKGAVSAWNLFYKNNVGFQVDEINETLSWVKPPGNAMFSLNHAVCYIDMEV